MSEADKTGRGDQRIEPVVRSEPVVVDLDTLAEPSTPVIDPAPVNGLHLLGGWSGRPPLSEADKANLADKENRIRLHQS